MTRVAIAHEWLVTYAGSERCVDQMLAVYPSARLLTTVIRRDRVPERLQRAQPSFLQRVPGAPAHHEWFLPLMPLAWRARPRLDDVDVVVSSSHACAKAVRYVPGTPHVCYCHTPMRYAWNFAAEQARFPRLVRPAARIGMGTFRRWDRRSAANVTEFLANSTAIAERIGRAYGRSARVVHPPVRTGFFTPGGERGEDFLFVGRLVGYKSPALLLSAFAGLPCRLLIVGDGAEREELEARAPQNVVFLGRVDDDRLRELYRTCKAFVYPVDEDFGIAMAEAQACGAPVIALSAGGASDIVVPGSTGWLVDQRTAPAFRSAIEVAARTPLDGVEISERAQRFSEARFRTEFEAIVEGHAGGR